MKMWNNDVKMQEMCRKLVDSMPNNESGDPRERWSDQIFNITVCCGLSCKLRSLIITF